MIVQSFTEISWRINKKLKIVEKRLQKKKKQEKLVKAQNDLKYALYVYAAIRVSVLHSANNPRTSGKEFRKTLTKYVQILRR